MGLLPSPKTVRHALEHLDWADRKDLDILGRADEWPVYIWPGLVFEFQCKVFPNEYPHHRQAALRRTAWLLFEYPSRTLFGSVRCEPPDAVARRRFFKDIGYTQQRRRCTAGRSSMDDEDSFEKTMQPYFLSSEPGHAEAWLLPLVGPPPQHTVGTIIQT